MQNMAVVVENASTSGDMSFDKHGCGPARSHGQHRRLSEYVSVPAPVASGAGRPARKEQAYVEHVVAEEEESSFWYRLDGEKSCTIVKCRTSSECLCVPSELGGCFVTRIEENAFSAVPRLRKVVCPTSLRVIASRAFVGAMGLHEVILNDGLEEIGEEAFGACFALRELVVPASVRRLGARIVGVMAGLHEKGMGTEVRISPANRNIEVDSHGLVYVLTARGRVLVDGSRFARRSLCPAPDTVEIGPGALMRNKSIEEVVLPEGLTRICEGAFRGCTALSSIVMPESLQEIQAGAFSCTNVKSLYVPAACVDIQEGALCTGPVFSESSQQPYSSRLREIHVHPDNPLYCMRGSVLCRRMCACSGKRVQPCDDCSLQAVLCPATAEDVDLTCGVTCIDAATFAGSSSIGTLRLRDGVAYSCTCDLLPHHSCKRIVIEFDEGPVGSVEPICLDIPAGKLGADVLKQSLEGDCLDARSLVNAYDQALSQMGEGVERERRMVARLAAPLYLAKQAEAEFSRAVKRAFWSMCAHFGAKNDWTGFDNMAKAGMFTRMNISDAIGRLSKAGYALAAGYLLDIKRQRFGKAAWDYAI